MRVVPDPFPPRAGDVPMLKLVRGRFTRLGTDVALKVIACLSTFTRFCGSCCVCANCDGGISTDWVSVGSTCDVVCEDKVMLQD